MSNLLKSNKKLVNEWDYEKNKDIDIINITDGSSKKVWWKCPKGHSYQSYVYNKRNGYGKCPYCKKEKFNKSTE